MAVLVGVGVALAGWLVVSVACAFAFGAVVRRRDRQIPMPGPRGEARVIVIPEPRAAGHAETEARIPSR